LVMCQWVTHRDRRFFPAPESFDPDRWLGEAAARIPKYAYYPHGGGGRYCLGHAFAEMQAVLVLPMIVRAFRLVPASDVPPETIPSFALIPRNGVMVTLERRAA
jgi:cytochrome P450